MNTDELINAAVEGMKKHINDVVDYARNIYTSTPYNKNQVASVVVAQFIGEYLSLLGLSSNIDEPVVGLYHDSVLSTYYWYEVDAVTSRKVK